MTHPGLAISTIAGVLMGAAIILCAQPVRADAPTRDTIRYCYNDWPPYSYLQEGEPAGVSVIVLREASRRAGYAARFVELPWKRCLRWVREGRFDAVIDAARRDDFLQGPTSYSVYTNTFWQRAGGVLGGPDPRALAGRSLGLVAGYTYGDALEAEIEETDIAVAFAKDDPDNAALLAHGRVDAIIGDFVGTRLLADRAGLDIEPVLPHHSVDRLYPSFNRDRAAMHDRVDAAVAGMIADGSVDVIYRSVAGIGFSEILP